MLCQSSEVSMCRDPSQLTSPVSETFRESRNALAGFPMENCRGTMILHFVHAASDIGGLHVFWARQVGVLNSNQAVTASFRSEDPPATTEA